MPTIDQLDIKITSSTDSATGSITKLQSELSKLSAAMSGMSTAGNTVISAMNRTGNAVTKLQQGLNSFNISGVVSKLQQFSQGLNSIQISSNLGRNIVNLASGIKTLNNQLGGNFQGLASVGEALQPISQIQTDGSLTGLISGIKRLPDAIAKLNQADIGLFRQNVSELVPALQELSTAAAGANDDLKGVGSNIRSVASATRSLSNSGTGTGSGSGGGLAGALKLGVSIVMLRRIASGLAEVISLSNKYQEDLNLFTAALGEYAEEAKTYAETVANAMGIDPAEWLRAQGVFQTLITGFGVVNDRAITMSQNLTQLGYDISSYFNISVSEAMTKLQSGISGELEPLRRLGYDLSEARLKAIALAKGIEESYQSMTQAEKSQLRYEAIMTQVTVAQGDMARTLDAPANQLRILQAQVTQAGRAIGNIFIPMLNAIIPIATAVVRAIRSIAEAIASLFGFTLTEVDYSGIDSATNSTDSLTDSLSSAGGKAKELQKQLMKFDEINQFSDTSSGGGGGGGSSGGTGSGWEWDLSSYNFLSEAISSKTDAIYNKIKPVTDFIKDNIGTILTLVAGVGTALAAWVIDASLLTDLGSVSEIGTLIKTAFAGVFTAGATVALTIHFEKEYLDTGKLGDLGKQIVASATGSGLAGSLLGKALTKAFPKLGAKKSISLGTGFAFTATGVATLAVAASDAMEEGWTFKNIFEELIGYFEIAAGGAIASTGLGISKKQGAGLGLSIAGIVTLGVTANDVMKEGWTKENLIQGLMSTFTTVTGFAVAAPAIEGVTATQGAGLGLAISGIATLGVTANDVMKEGWTTKSFIEGLMSTFTTVTGLAVAAPAIEGVTATQGAGLGLAISAIASLSSVTVREAEQGINFETVSNGIISIIQAGLGAYMMFGNLYVSLAAMGVATVVQLGAILINYSEDDLKTSANHTAEELSDTANKMFSLITADANITLQPQITNVEAASKEFNAAAAAFKEISVPVNLTPENATGILENLNNLITAANNLSDAQKTKLQAFVELAPAGSLTGEDSNITDLLTGGVITTDLEAAGKGFSEALQKGMEEGWTEGLTDLYNMYRNDILILTSSFGGSEVQGAAMASMAGLMAQLKNGDYSIGDVQGIYEQMLTLEADTRASLGTTYDEQLLQAYTRVADYETKSGQWAELAKQAGISEESRAHYEQLAAEYAGYAAELAAELQTWNKEEWVNNASEKLFGDTYSELEAMIISGANDILTGFTYENASRDQTSAMYLTGQTEADYSLMFTQIWNSLLDTETQGYVTQIPDSFIQELSKNNSIDYDTLSSYLTKWGYEIVGAAAPAETTSDFTETGDTFSAAVTQLATEVDTMDTASDTVSTGADSIKSAGDTLKSVSSVMTLVGKQFASAVYTFSAAATTKQNANASNGGYGATSMRPITKNASGGFPASGSLFIAGEAGPELVGKIGNKTAVVNDEQIALTLSKQMNAGGGINEAALATAIVGALRSAGMGAVYLDGQQLAQSINRESQRTGRSAIRI